MRVKAKTWGVIGQNSKNTKSLLQTVLITASGPQALNALAHRVRYTQGSRQNRCVSLREALALRATGVGTAWISAGRPLPDTFAYAGLPRVRGGVPVDGRSRGYPREAGQLVSLHHPGVRLQ